MITMWSAKTTKKRRRLYKSKRAKKTVKRPHKPDKRPRGKAGCAKSDHFRTERWPPSGEGGPTGPGIFADHVQRVPNLRKRGRAIEEKGGKVRTIGVYCKSPRGWNRTGEGYPKIIMKAHCCPLRIIFSFFFTLPHQSLVFWGKIYDFLRSNLRKCSISVAKV